MTALVSIDGFDFPEPSSYKGTTSTLVDSARNAQGYVVGSVIRDDVAKVELKWKYLTATQWAGILQCFNRNFGGNFYRNVTFFNEVSNAWETRQMYVGDRSAPIFKRDPITGIVDGYTDVSISLVEV